MSNPFHSFHVQSGGVRLHKLSNHYRKNNKNSKFQPLMLQENKDLVVPIDLLHVPPHSYHCSQTPQHNNDYYIYPQHHQQPPPLEIIQIHVQPQQQEYKHYPVLDDEQFDQMFVNISTTPKASRNKASHKKKPKTPKNTKKGKSKRTFKNLNKTSK